jgi:glycosyltransferase involved in cell wall biosynthesis/GT2 family glycosyltransferase
MYSVSIVIPCYNPQPFLLETLASARAQTCGHVEIVLVNDGTSTPEGSTLLQAAAPTVDRYIEQPNRGLPAARNAGFNAASSEFVIPLDADDLLDPDYARVSIAAAAQHPNAAFIYTDYKVFGTQSYIERAPDYNFYRLLDRNTLTYAALIRRSAWAAAGGYDESMTRGYEDWEFWLRLGSLGRFGRHAVGELFRYRKHGPSLLDVARSNHETIAGYIRTKHGELYSDAGRASLKARWEPSVCIIGEADRQTLADCAFIRRPEEAPPDASAFLVPGSGAFLDPHDGEYAALAVWGGRSPLRLPDGSVAHAGGKRRQGASPAATAARAPAAAPGPLRALRRHLVNAELLSLDSWLLHPLRSTLRLIPLRLKERINRAARHEVFDLTFYLQFQPGSAVLGGTLMEPLVYFPRLDSGRRRVALVTPHLGAGGAESVLLEIAAALDRSQFEILIVAVQSRDGRWAERWRQAADHVYDLSMLVSPEKLPAATYSVIANWKPDTVLIQNSLIAYAVVPHLRKALPAVRLLDLVHSVDEDWNMLTATAAVCGDLDLRVAVSETVRRRLIESGEPAAKTCVARNGIDLQRFSASPPLRGAQPYRILFAGRLDAVKRPLLLPDIALALRRLRPAADFRFVVAGDGPESSDLYRRLKRAGIATLFEFRGQVPDIAPLLADCDVLLLPSRAEGLPLVILEAFAASRPVVASTVGAIPDVVSARTGILVPLGAAEVEAFATAIDSLLRSPDRRRDMGQNGRSLVAAEYTQEAARERYRRLFSLVMPAAP